MSATNRGAVREPNDFYETPPECTRAILPYLKEAGRRGHVCDPCCGDRAILDIIESEYQIKASDTYNSGIDIDPNRKCDFERDALSDETWGEPDLVISNPPYKHALEFVLTALYRVKPTGTVAMLLRLPFLESVTRQDFHRDYPADIYVFAKRPSFTKNGKTDATAYAWFVWGPGRGGRWTILPHHKDKS